MVEWCTAACCASEGSHFLLAAEASEPASAFAEELELDFDMQCLDRMHGL